jgi:ribosomal protein S18 acetylase RimI-like enzyme
VSVIEKATLGDIPQLCELLTLLFEQEEDFQPDVERHSRGLRQIIENPDVGIILVLREGPTVLGMVNVLYSVSTACGGRVAIIEDLVVQPGNRNRGLGSSMVRKAIEIARGKGCLRITLLTDRTNDSAFRFYRRHGFRPSAMTPLRLLL